jgi:hypothetical protein
MLTSELDGSRDRLSVVGTGDGRMPRASFGVDCVRCMESAILTDPVANDNVSFSFTYIT